MLRGGSDISEGGSDVGRLAGRYLYGDEVGVRILGDCDDVRRRAECVPEARERSGERRGRCAGFCKIVPREERPERASVPVKARARNGSRGKLYFRDTLAICGEYLGGLGEDPFGPGKFARNAESVRGRFGDAEFVRGMRERGEERPRNQGVVERCREFSEDGVD